MTFVQGLVLGPIIFLCSWFFGWLILEELKRYLVDEELKNIYFRLNNLEAKHKKIKRNI